MRAEIAFLLTLLLLSPARAVAEVASVYLVQDSGWMEPFYVDPSVPFRPLLEALVAASDAGGDTVIASFDQNNQIPGRSSPNVLYRGANDPAAVARAVAALSLPKQPNGHFADADFDGALVGAINTVLAGKPGIVWLVTNNRNSPNNSQRVAENTRDFARRLGSSPVLPVIVSYPVRLPAKGALFESSGLIVYGIAYGEEAGRVLRRLTQAPPLRHLFRDPAVQLKPLDQAPLAFTPERTLTPGLAAARLSDNSLRISGIPGGRASDVQIEGRLRSDYYPHVIDRARLSVRWQPPSGPEAGTLPALAAAIAPGDVHALQPGQAMPGVRLSLEIPRIARAPGLRGWLQKDIALRGSLVIGLDDLSLSLGTGFSAKMAQIAALDQLPSVFFDNRTVAAATAVVPVVLVVHFSPLPLIAALSILFALLLLLLLLVAVLRRSREHAVSLGGQIRRVRLRPWERRSVVLPGGQTFRLRGRLFGPPYVAERADPDAR